MATNARTYTEQEKQHARRLRGEGMPMKKIAATMGVPESTVGNWFAGYRKPRDEIEDVSKNILVGKAKVLWCDMRAAWVGLRGTLLVTEQEARDYAWKINEVMHGRTGS